MRKEKIADLLVPTERAQIHWSWRQDQRPGVIVFWRPEKDAPSDCDGWRIIWADLLGRSDCSDGACWMDWGTRGRRSDYFGDCTLEHIFAGIIADSHRPEPEIWRSFYWETVRQFARIKGCPWARTMLEQRENRAITREDLAPYAVLPNGTRCWLPMGPFSKGYATAA
jgi:hypothetical protein